MCSTRLGIAAMFFLSMLQLLLAAFAMMHKRESAYLGETLLPTKRFRSNVADLFLTGQVSGQRASSVFQDAQAAGAAFVHDLNRTWPQKKALTEEAFYDWKGSCVTQHMHTHVQLVNIHIGVWLRDP